MLTAQLFLYWVETETALLTQSLSWEDDFGRRDSDSLSITTYYVNLFEHSTF